MLKIPARFKQCDLSVSLAFDYCDCILNMGTRAAAFTAKVRSLCDFQLRLMQGVLPPPSGVDIANTIKYFSQTLLTVLKDVTDSPIELLKDPEMDATRLALFPSLDYKALYNSLIPLMEVAPLIQYGLHAFGQAILQCLGCLLPFLEHDLIDNLPYLTASSVAVLPSSLHQDIVNSLCFYILPFTITRYNNREHEICQSISAVIMMVFQYSSNPAHHCQLLECLMTLKQNILKDILSVIAYGASTARSSAAKLLFYYWPPFNANLLDRKGLTCKLADTSIFVCQRDSCPNAGSAEAAKVCYDHCISITFATDSPPPLYLCIECANEIHREHPNQMFFDILHPMQQKPMICENKNCRSTDKSAISICFSTECASYNGNHPIRYCEQCHNNRHNTRRGGDHIVHKCIPATWNMDIEMQTYMVESVVSLLKEAKIPVVEQKEPTDGKTPPPPAIDNITIEERQQLGKYGVWLLVGRCTPEENTPEEVLGRLLAMLFHWFHVTAYSYDVVGQEESTLEKLKNDHVCDWLKNIAQTHYKLFISCLLPHPPEFAQVGGHWDTLASRTSHLKDGLTRLFCLTSYDNVITQEIWDFVMPHWMDAIVNDVPEKELPELRTILNKILEAQMCDIEADIAPKKVYNFVAIRFDKTTAKIQQQALQWLQILTMLEITIKLEFLYDIFGKGVNYMKLGAEEIEKMMRIFKEDSEKKSPSLLTDDSDSTVTSFSDDSRPSQQADCESDAEHNLFCCILMLDILLKQMELQAIDKHTGLNSELSKNVCGLLKCMLTAAWIGSHSCSVKSDCGYCESSIMWHQLSLNLVKYMSPIYPVHPPDPPIEDLYDDQSRKSPPEGDKKECKADVVLNVPIPEVHSVGGVLVNMPHVCSIMTATVETVSEQLDLPIIQSDSRTVLSVQRAYTLTEYDDPTPIQSQTTEEALESPPEEDTENCWQTSIGKFKFCVDDLPNPLQYIYQLLQELSKTDKPDVLYYMLQCLNVLCLHGDACTKSSKDHRGFFIWCQENLIIRNLWDLLNSEHSHICQEVVPLLLHCITLPAGSDVFWRVIQEEFHNIDWRVRFVAVERVTVIARFMDSSPLRNILQLQAALANAFCYLISSMDDPNVYVAQRATLYLGTIHDAAIKSLIMCLETQFDSVIVDRPMVLQSIYQLHNSLSERKILTWEFFLNRFDTLFLEAQINFEKSGDISYMRDLRNTDLNSEVFIRKLHRAHEALSHSDGSGVSSVKTLSASFGTKWPYKRTMSAPASIIPRQDNRESREKVYSRQYSAPILKRKTSRFGLGQFLGTINNVLDGHVHSLNVVDDQNLLGYLQRVIDLEEADKETMHLLVFLLMQFLSRSDQAYPTEDKYISKSQDIVLRHLYLLLGYSQNDRCHFLPPQRLRLSPAFSVFISNLPQLLDQNHLMGRMLLSTSLILLHYSPSPFYMPNNLELQQPTYSLWSLEPHLRRNWLMALVVLLYKYQYNAQPHCLHLTSLVKIVLNTLDSQHHHCRRIPATILMGAPSTRSRDVSQPSLGAENEQHDRLTTPPLSPMYSDGQSVQVSLSSKGGKTQVIYAKPSSAASMETHWEEAIQCIPDKRIDKTKFTEISLDADDTESELNAIPESDLSDSTLHGSVQDSFDEGTEDLCYHKSEKSCMVKVQEPQDQRSPKEVYISKLVKHKRPIWIIGSEEEALKSWESKTYSIQEISKLENGAGKNCTKPGNVTVAKTLTTDSHRQVTCSSIDTQHISKPSPLGKHKKIIEPCITPVSTPVSDCEECLKNQAQVLPPPAIERLLPIGSIRPPVPRNTTFPFYEDITSTSSDSSIFNMELTIDSPKTHIFAAETQLEIPNQERLLPIGQHTKDISQLVEKVKQALGINAQQITKIPEIKKVENGRDSYYPQSPRRLIKQVALESPPQYDIEENTITFKSINMDGKKESTTNHRHPIRKAGPFTIRPYSCRDPKRPGFWLSPQLSPRIEGNDIKQSSFRIGDECVTERCSECGTVKEEYSDEELGLCIVCLGTFIHREPSLAAPMLPDILNIVAKVATNAMYPWQHESNIHLPGGAVSVAHQFLRCVLHQLAPNGIFTQMFQTPTNEKSRIQFFKNVIQALIDFNELNPVAPLQLLLETLNSKKTLPLDALPIILENLACYMDCLPLEAALGSNAPLWNNVLQQMETFFRRIVFLLHGLDNLTVLLRIIITIFKIPLINQYKGMLEPFSKIMSHAIQTNVLKYNNLVDICFLCNRAFIKDRDKMLLSRMVVFELVQALKFKTCIPDANLLMLINLILQDVGGSIPANVVLKDMNSITIDFTPIWNTNIAECMKVHLTDILEFLTDFHTLAKIKSYSKGITMGLNEDTLGGIFKCNVAQYLALEISRGNGRDNRAVSRYLPWLYNTSTAQQPPKEFVECIGHVRLLSWLLLGSLTHTAIHGNDASHLSQPIPQEASCQIADHIQVIMAGFAEQPKASVLHMSSLFHTFILCQLWTIYLEQGLNTHLPITEAYNITMNILFDFWGKITPCILQLVQQSKVLSEIVCLHFLNLIEALIECHSTFITKLFPLWIPVLTSQSIQLPGHLQVRLQNCLNFAPDVHIEGLPEKIKTSLQNPVLLRWLQRLQFKMGQIELQSSTATQFYSL